MLDRDSVLPYADRVIQCPSCAVPLAADARFCSSCGRAVVATLAEERRIVTVLFGDVVGFTTLAEHLDPEQLKRLVDNAFERLVDDVVAFGGRVDKLLGDGILALFGAPVAHEDDAERAVRAALRMQRSLGEFVARSNLDLPLRMRIGINTGEVLVGTLAGTDYTAMGDVVNTASRLQEEAPPGGVLVGEATYTQTRGAIEYGAPTELQPRGRERSIVTWVALDALAPPGSRQRRTDLRLVGREPELTLARAAANLALRERRSLVLNISGESGVGKTRLVDELLATPHNPDPGEAAQAGGLAGATVLEGVCVPYGVTNVWSPIADALIDHFEIDPLMAIDELRTIVRAKAARALVADPSGADADRFVEVFLHLLGYESDLDRHDAVCRRDAIHTTIARMVEGHAHKVPLVLWIDDLQSADQVVIDLLGHLAVSITRQPFVLITSMRPGGDVEWPPSSDRISVVSMVVHPLTRVDSDELALELLGELTDRGVTDRRFLGTLFDRSGGNPLFLQQLASVVAEEGLASELPESLRALIAARLDQLPMLERRALDNAATLGLTGSIAGLGRFAAAMKQDFDRSLLANLEAKGFLEVDGQKWRFRSDSVRETAYQRLTKASRAQRHAGVAASMAEHTPNALDDLAHHSATAAELVHEIGTVAMVPPTIRDDALRFLDAAIDRARQTGSQRLLVRHTTRAIGLLADDSNESKSTSLERMRLMLDRCAALTELREYQRARVDIDIVLADAVARCDTVQEGSARKALGFLHHLHGDQAEARAELGSSIELLRAAGDLVQLADALRQRGFMELFGGSLVDAEWFLGEADAVYATLDDERGRAYVEQHRAWLAFLAGELELADERLHRAADTLERLGDRNGVGWAFGLLAFVRFFQRRFGEAEDLAVIVGAEADQRGDDWAAAMMQTLMADLRLWSGRLTDALGHAEQARNRFRRLGDPFGMVQALSALIRVQVALGRTVARRRTAEELLALADASPAGPIPLIAVAGAAMHAGDARVAFDTIGRAEDDMVRRGTGHFEATVIRAIASAQLNMVDEAVAAIESLSAEARTFPFAGAASALVQWLAGDPVAALREAAAVTAAPGASYLDRAIAAVAASGAHSSLADVASATAVLDDSLTESLAIGDVVAVALLQQAFARVTGLEHPSATGTDEVLGDGWRYVLEQLAVAESVR